MSRDIFDVDVDNEIETGMNLAALRYDLQLCREHVDTETLAFAIHHVLQDDTEELISCGATHPPPEQRGKREGRRRGYCEQTVASVTSTSSKGRGRSGVTKTCVL